MKRFFIGLQLYSVRVDAEKDLRGTLREVAAMGYDGVELAGLYGHSASEVRAMVADAGLTPISAHVGLAEFRQGVEETVARYREIGCRYLAIPHLAPEDRPDSATFDRTAKEILLIAQECRKQGLTLLYHNHDFEFATLPDGRTFLEVLYACAPEDLLQTEVDTCWAHIVGVDPAALLRRYVGRAPLVHLKDYSGDRPAKHYEDIHVAHTPASDAAPFSLQPVGRGVQKFSSVISAAADAGAEWLIVEQDEPAAGETAMDSARFSVQYVRSIL